jgi:hypothetical protein
MPPVPACVLSEAVVIVGVEQRHALAFDRHLAVFVEALDFGLESVSATFRYRLLLLLGSLSVRALEHRRSL